MRLAFALRDRIRLVNGFYVVLANELDCALVTTDRQQVVITSRNPG